MQYSAVWWLILPAGLVSLFPFLRLPSSCFLLSFSIHSLLSFSVCYGGVKAFLAFILVYDCCLPLFLFLFRINCLGSTAG